MTEKTMEVETQEAEAPVRMERRRTYTPRVDIYEMDDKVTVLADMPGVDEFSLDITLENNVLTIKGRVESPSFENHRLAHAEYRVGDYVRSFTLSDTIDHDSIEATVKNGVLRLSLSKAEAAKARKIEVRSDN
jgi:HSP20 family molecular chaperone IbpA